MHFLQLYLKPLICIHNFKILVSRSKHVKPLQMLESKTAYLHLKDGSDKFSVSFHYTNDKLGVDRLFNFERPVNETVKGFLTRVSSNVKKVVSSKLKKKCKKGQLEEGKTDIVGSTVDLVTVELLSDENTKIPNTEICQEVFFSKASPNQVILRIMGNDFTVAINSPWIDSIKLPSSIMVGFQVYPSCFKAQFTDNNLSSFVWMKSVKRSESPSPGKATNSKKEHFQWSVVGDGFLYYPVIKDIGCKLKVVCTPKNASSIGPIREAESANVVEAGPGECPFEVRNLYTQHKTSNGSFRVVSYNILADVYASTDTAHNDLFDYCPKYALSIDYRKHLFLKEVLGYNADLVCLQEVDTKVFESDLVPVLGVQGLIGVHGEKPTKREGVSTFYSSSKFRLLEVKKVVLSEELLQKSYCSHILRCVDQNPELMKRTTALGTTALAVVLESVDRPEELLVVGNTHLYFHPDADHIRLVQGGVVMAFLTHLVNTIKEEHSGKTVSLILSGDFNSVPECGMYRLITTKSIPADLPDWKSNPGEEVKDLSLSQPFNMESACGIPEYTNYTVSFAACLDYIFYQTDRLNVEAVVPLPTGDVLREHRAIPSVVFPSDHVALVAELKWKVPNKI